MTPTIHPLTITKFSLSFVTGTIWQYYSTVQSWVLPAISARWIDGWMVVFDSILFPFGILMTKFLSHLKKGEQKDFFFQKKPLSLTFWFIDVTFFPVFKNQVLSILTLIYAPKVTPQLFNFEHFHDFYLS